MLQQDEYTRLLKENITKTYKKSTRKKLFNINRTTKKITEKLPISDRIDKMLETEYIYTYITIKDHKEYFPNKISCRFINLSKSSIGKISKRILDKFNNIVQSKTSANQWKDTSVIEWLISIKNKESSSFIVFDTESFHPSIPEDLFKSAIQFARELIDISDCDLSLIYQARKTLLFHENTPWIKKKKATRILMSLWIVLIG